MYLHIIGFFVLCVFFNIHLKIFSEEIHGSHQTVKGVLGTQKIRNSAQHNF